MGTTGTRASTVMAAALASALLCSCSCADSTLDPVGPFDSGADDAAPDFDAADEGDPGEADLGDPLPDPDVPDEVEVPAGSLVVAVTGRDFWRGVLGAVEGAGLAVDLPGGGRVEATTGPGGLATFGPVDWEAGAAAVTAHAEGRGIASMVGIEGAGEVHVTLELPSVLPSAIPVGSPTISGSVTGMVDESWYISVDGLDFSSSFGWRGPDWSIAIPAGEAVTVMLLGSTFESIPEVSGFDQSFVSSRILAAGPYVSDAVLEVDLDPWSPSGSASGSFLTPLRAESPAHSEAATCYSSVFPWAEATTNGPPATIGWVGGPVHAGRSTDLTRVDYDVEWVEWPGATSPATVYGMEVPETYGGGECAAWVHGYPEPGMQGFEFVEIPEIVVPEDRLLPHPLGEAIEWQAFDPGVVPVLVLELDAAATTWRIAGQAGTTSIAAPDPPSFVDLPSMAGSGEIVGYVELVSYAPSGPAFARTAASAYMRFSIH